MAKRDFSRSGEIWSINNAKTRGHKGLINRRKNGKIDYVSFTHSPITQRTKNIRMSQNPDILDTQLSYIRPKLYLGKIEDLGKYFPDMKIRNSRDKSIVRKILKSGKLK